MHGSAQTAVRLMMLSDKFTGDVKLPAITEEEMAVDAEISITALQLSGELRLAFFPPAQSEQ
jgi:hypothetical protein